MIADVWDEENSHLCTQNTKDQGTSKPNGILKSILKILSRHVYTHTDAQMQTLIQSVTSK